MKAVLLGAGAIGSVIASLLGRREEGEHVLVADRSLDAAKALATTHDGGRLAAAPLRRPAVVRAPAPAAPPGPGPVSGPAHSLPPPRAAPPRHGRGGPRAGWG